MAHVGIRRITKIENDSDYYDLQVRHTCNFFANGILVHNSFTCLSLLPPGPEGIPMVSSKGLLTKGTGFKDVPENAQNLYMRVYKYFKAQARIKAAFPYEVENGIPVYVFGETFGIQDLKYGASSAQDETLGFRVFDVFIGKPINGRFLNDEELDEACGRLQLPRVPILYRGPYSKEKLLELTSGKETVTGKGLHLREGVVVKSTIERKYPGLPQNRVQLKSVSSAYLLRSHKGGEEPTELE